MLIAEDKEAVIKIIRKCRSIALGHLPRTHRIDVNWLFEVCGSPEIQLRYCSTKQQIADLMTKALNSPPAWQYLCDLAQIRAGPLPADKRPNTTPPTTTPHKTTGANTVQATLPLTACFACGLIPYNDQCMCDDC